MYLVHAMREDPPLDTPSYLPKRHCDHHSSVCSAYSGLFCGLSRQSADEKT